jgi:hypothetical protein
VCRQEDAILDGVARSAVNYVIRSLPVHSNPIAGIDVVHDGILIVSYTLDRLIRV